MNRLDYVSVALFGGGLYSLLKYFEPSPGLTEEGFVVARIPKHACAGRCAPPRLFRRPPRT